MGGSGKFPVWLADGLISENGLIDGESEDHWVTCYLAAGELCRAGYRDVKVNNWGGQKIEDIPDITCISPSGERIWIEVEQPRKDKTGGNHSISQIETKKQKQSPYCDVWICLCQKANYVQVKTAVGKGFCVMRGVNFAKIIEKHGIKNQTNISGSSDLTEAGYNPIKNDTGLRRVWKCANSYRRRHNMTIHHGPGECASLAPPGPGMAGLCQLLLRGNRTYDENQQRLKIIKTVNKVFKATTRFNYSMPKKDIFCFDDSNACGEYFSLDLNVWEEIAFSIDEHNRISAGRKHAGKEVRFFAHIKDGGEIKKSDSLISFPRENYAEIRRVRGENIGLPLTVNTNGTVWAGNRFINMDMQIFTRRN